MFGFCGVSADALLRFAAQSLPTADCRLPDCVLLRVADRHRQRIGRMIGGRRLREPQQRGDHPLHLVLACAAVPQTASLIAWGV